MKLISAPPFFFLFFLSHFLLGQIPDDEKSVSPFLFDNFIESKVLLKNRQVTPAMVNYNIFTEELVYMDRKVLMALDPTTVDTIWAGQRVFIPIDNYFCEVVKRNNAVLLVRHKAEFENHGKHLGYGMYSKTSATTSLNSVESNGRLQELKVPSDYHLKPISQMKIRKGKKTVNITSKKTLINLYPEKKEEILQYIKDYNPDFNNFADFLKLFLMVEE